MNDWNAELYDEKHDFVSEYGRELIQWLNPTRGEHVLDLGCGTGELAYAIQNLGAQVTAIDSSQEMISKARLSYPGVDFRVEDILNFTHTTRYDCVFSNAVLHWITQPNQAISQMFSHLKPGGRMVLEMGGSGNVNLDRQIQCVTLTFNSCRLSVHSHFIFYRPRQIIVDRN